MKSKNKEDYHLSTLSYVGDTIEQTRERLRLKKLKTMEKECNHICSSNCRQNGCNCECGEWHLDPCGMCGGTGEISCDERDSDGNIQHGVGTQKCECQLDNEIDMSGATPGDR